MTLDPRLTGLLELTEAVEAKEKTRLAEVSQRIRSLKRAIEDLRAPNAEPVDSAFTRACMDASWSAWRNKKTIELNREIARLYAERSVQKKVTSRALGRRLVVEKLTSKGEKK